VALLRQQLEDAARRLLDELEAARVVRERDVRELNLLDTILKMWKYKKRSVRKKW
jgi:hypothetical protein